MRALEISIHVPLAGDDQLCDLWEALLFNFYPRPPCGGRLPIPAMCSAPQCDFYPRPPCGGRPPGFTLLFPPAEFLSTSPLRGTTVRRWGMGRRSLYFYPRPPCGGRRAGRGFLPGANHFYPRPPCGGRPTLRFMGSPPFQFLSTSPLRGTTWNDEVRGYDGSHFYPRPPCGGRPRWWRLDIIWGTFLSTSPLRGTTRGLVPLIPGSRYFYPRPPCGGRRKSAGNRAGYQHFYPRPPCGGRPGKYLRRST